VVAASPPALGLAVFFFLFGGFNFVLLFFFSGVADLRFGSGARPAAPVGMALVSVLYPISLFPCSFCMCSARGSDCLLSR
jgi:hypothetical protein